MSSAIGYKCMSCGFEKEMTDKITYVCEKCNSNLEIVYDYSKTLEYVNNYVKEHKENFIKENEQNIDNDKFMDYKLTELEKVSDKKTYSINFSLIKENDEWLIEDLDKSDIEKIHGIYIE